jgi:RNA polymerase sigma-70 factor (ECF subfamily)
VDDVGLVQRLLRGDEAAFSTLFERHKAAVYRYALHMRAGDAASADDIVQEVFLAFLQQAARFDSSRGTVVAYLLGIARRQVFRQLGRDRVAEPVDVIDDDMPIAAPMVDPLEGLTRAETVAQVRLAIAALPPVFQEAIVLCDLNELDYVAAAAVIGCPIGTVGARRGRARAQVL